MRHAAAIPSAVITLLGIVALTACAGAPHPANSSLMAVSREPVSDGSGRVYAADDRVFCSFPNSPNPHLARVELAARPCAVGGGTILGPATLQTSTAETFGPDHEMVFCNFSSSANRAMARIEVAARTCTQGGGTILGPATPARPPSASTLEAGDLISLTSQQQLIVRTTIAKQLKDPESARFGKMAGTRDSKDGSITVCGYVNAKNSYGGYTGMSPFLGVLLAPPRNNSFELVQLASTTIERQAVIATCGQAGVPLSL